MDKLKNEEIEFLFNAIGKAVGNACGYNDADWEQSYDKSMLEKIKAKLLNKNTREVETINEIFIRTKKEWLDLDVDSLPENTMIIVQF